MNIQGISAANLNNSKQQNFKARTIKGYEINHYGNEVYSYIPKGWCNLNQLADHCFLYRLNSWLNESKLIKMDTLKLEQRPHYAPDQFILNSKEVGRAEKYLKAIDKSVHYASNDEFDKAAKKIGFIDFLAGLRKNAKDVPHEKISEIDRFKNASEKSRHERENLDREALEAKILNAFR